MKVNKTIRSKAKIDYLLAHGVMDIDTQYFINKIDEGIQQNNNESFKTNVRGFMTSWDYFLKDNNFLKAIFPLFDYLDELKLKEYYINSAWGLKESFSHHTIEHDHRPYYLSGIIYLQDHNQKLLFTEIKKEFKPKKNSFIIFSSFLKHKTTRNISSVDKYAISFNIDFGKFPGGTIYTI